MWFGVKENKFASILYSSSLSSISIASCFHLPAFGLKVLLVSGPLQSMTISKFWFLFSKSSTRWNQALHHHKMWQVMCKVGWLCWLLINDQLPVCAVFNYESSQHATWAKGWGNIWAGGICWMLQGEYYTPYVLPEQQYVCLLCLLTHLSCHIGTTSTVSMLATSLDMCRLNMTPLPSI